MTGNHSVASGAGRFIGMVMSCEEVDTLTGLTMLRAGAKMFWQPSMYASFVRGFQRAMNDAGVECDLILDQAFNQRECV